MDVVRPDRMDGIEIEQRRHQVALLYLAHQTERAIARQLGVAPSTVHKDLQALRREWREENRFALDEIMEREIVELDEMEAYAVQQMAQQKEREGRAAWFDRRLRVKERRAKMLRFDAADQATPVPGGETGVSFDMDRARSEFAQALLAIADEGEARVRVERSLAASSVVIEGGLGGDPGPPGAAPPAGGLDDLAGERGARVGEDGDG